LVYLGIGNDVYAFRAGTGTLAWKYSTEGAVSSAPALLDRAVYITSSDNNVYALDAYTGALLWKYGTEKGLEDLESQVVVANGMVYIATLNAAIYALDASTGSRVWWWKPYAAGGFSTPAVADGVLYVVAYQGSYPNIKTSLYSFNAYTGQLLRIYQATDFWGPVAVANGVIYVASGQVNHYAIAALDPVTGELLWKYDVGYGSVDTLAVVNGIVYVGLGNEMISVYAFALPGGVKPQPRPNPQTLHPDFSLH